MLNTCITVQSKLKIAHNRHQPDNLDSSPCKVLSPHWHRVRRVWAIKPNEHRPTCARFPFPLPSPPCTQCLPPYPLSYFSCCALFRFRSMTIVLHFYWWASLLFFTTYTPNPDRTGTEQEARGWTGLQQPILLTRAQCGIVAPEAIFHTISTSTSVRNVSLSLYTASVRLLSARIISVMTNDINGTHLPVPLLMRCRKSNQTSMRGSF